jgi:hypothetical protein
MTKNDKKCLIDEFFQHLTLQPPIRHTNASHRPINVVQVSYVITLGLTTLMTPHSYPTSHHSHLSVTKNGKKLFITMFCWLLPSDDPFPHIIGQQMVSSLPKTPLKVPFISKIPHMYTTGYYSHLSDTKNGKKRWKKMFLHVCFHKLLLYI